MNDNAKKYIDASSLPVYSERALDILNFILCSFRRYTNSRRYIREITTFARAQDGSVYPSNFAMDRYPNELQDYDSFYMSKSSVLGLMKWFVKEFSADKKFYSFGKQRGKCTENMKDTIVKEMFYGYPLDKVLYMPTRFKWSCASSKIDDEEYKKTVYSSEFGTAYTNGFTIRDVYIIYELVKYGGKTNYEYPKDVVDELRGVKKNPIDTQYNERIYCMISDVKAKILNVEKFIMDTDAEYAKLTAAFRLAQRTMNDYYTKRRDELIAGYECEIKELQKKLL